MITRISYTQNMMDLIPLWSSAFGLGYCQAMQTLSLWFTQACMQRGIAHIVNARGIPEHASPLRMKTLSRSLFLEWTGNLLLLHRFVWFWVVTYILPLQPTKPFSGSNSSVEKEAQPLENSSLEWRKTSDLLSGTVVYKSAFPAIPHFFLKK